MVKFRQVWTILGKPGQVWTSLGKSGQVETSLDKFRQFSTIFFVISRNQRLMRDMPHFMVEIVHTIKMDSYWLCGAAPMKKLMVLLALPKVIEGRLVNIGKLSHYRLIFTVIISYITYFVIKFWTRHFFKIINLFRFEYV